MGKKLAIGALLFVLVASSVGSLANTALNFKDRMSPPKAAPAEATNSSVSDAIKTLDENDQKLVTGQQTLANAIGEIQTRFTAENASLADSVTQAISQTGATTTSWLEEFNQRLAALETSGQNAGETSQNWLPNLNQKLGGTGTNDGGTGNPGTSGNSKTVAVPKAPPDRQTDSLEKIASEETTWFSETWFKSQATDWSRPYLPPLNEFDAWLDDLWTRIGALGYEDPGQTDQYRFGDELYGTAYEITGSSPNWNKAKEHARTADSLDVLSSTDPSVLGMVERLEAVQEACAAVQRDFEMDCHNYPDCLEASEVYTCIAQAASVAGSGPSEQAAATSDLAVQIRDAIQTAGFLADPVSLGIILDGLATGKWATVAEAVTAWFTDEGEENPPIIEYPPEWAAACEALRDRLDCEEYLECKRVPGDKTICIVGRHLRFEMDEHGAIKNPTDQEVAQHWLTQ